jgi:GDP-L-fucose synthase
MLTWLENKTIFVSGHRGLVGSACLRALKALNVKVITASHADLDCANQNAVQSFFKQYHFDAVILAAAKVGGIWANQHYPAEFIEENLLISANVLSAARQHLIERVIYLGSSCIYPRACPQPIREEYLLTSALEPSNRPYALAKIAGVELCWAYNRQYAAQFLALMPTNLYGPGDHYHPQNSHVIPALIQRFHEAKLKNAPEVTVWGSGSPLREFLYVDDLAEAILFLLDLPDQQFKALCHQVDQAPLLNVGTGTDISIAEAAQLIQQTVGYKGEIRWDRSKPDGTPRKCLDVTRLSQLGWKASTPLTEGLKQSYHAYRYAAESTLVKASP